MTEAIGGNAQAVTAFIARWQDSGAAERATLLTSISSSRDSLYSGSIRLSKARATIEKSEYI